MTLGGEDQKDPRLIPERLGERDILWLVYGALEGLQKQQARQAQLLRICVLLLGMIAAGRAVLDLVPGVVGP